MDTRVARTKQRLQDALFSLARERGLEQVSVSDIADFAGVNRSTFYQHYSDKETVLADALDALAARAGAQLDAISVWSLEPPEPLVVFLEHVEENAVVYSRVFTQPGSVVVLGRLRAHIAAAVNELARSRGDQALPLDVVAAGVAGSVIGVMGAWLERDPLPPAREAAGWMWKVILGPRRDFGEAGEPWGS